MISFPQEPNWTLSERATASPGWLAVSRSRGPDVLTLSSTVIGNLLYICHFFSSFFV